MVEELLRHNERTARSRYSPRFLWMLTDRPSVENPLFSVSSPTMYWTCERCCANIQVWLGSALRVSMPRELNGRQRQRSGVGSLRD